MSETCSEHHGHCAHHAAHHELVIQGVSVRYRKTLALENVSFATSCGNRLALIGPNGAGKSTLLKAIAGLVPRTTGSLQWRGKPVHKWSREFAYLPQREEVDWSFPITVRGLVEMGRYPQTGMFGKFTSEDDRAVNRALEALRLTDLESRQIRELSGGQQQRAFLARALAQEAHVLLLDEPFTGLDRSAARNLSELLASLAAEGRLVIASHHDLASAALLFDEVLLLKTSAHGFGPPQAVMTEENLSRLFGPMNAGELKSS
jgi:ABC-type Mn2+/Zn2+ transport system ATPase subunit